MKIFRQTRQVSTLMVFALIVLSACTGQVQSKLTAQPSVILNSPTRSLPSRIPTITETQIPNQFSTETNTPIPVTTIAPTSQPTLEPTQFIEALQKFLGQGNDCPSPCVFGIIPGQTTLDQAQSVFRVLRNPLSENKYPNGKKYYSTLLGFKENGISISIRVSEENGIVKNIRAGITLPKHKEIPEPRTWQAYSPETIINNYGDPTNIDFFLSFPHEEGFPTDTAWYDMVMDYKKLNLTIQYFHGWTLEAKLIKACPNTDPFDTVTVYLGKDFDYPPPTGVSLEKATSLTLEQFSNLLKQNSGAACFNISKEAIFPSN